MMVRLRNTSTGVVVRVDDQTAARLPREWQSTEKPKPASRRRKAAAGDDGEK